MVKHWLLTYISFVNQLDLGLIIVVVEICVQNYISILLKHDTVWMLAWYNDFLSKALCVRFCSRFDVTFPGFRHFDNSCSPLWLLWFWFFLICCKFCLSLQWHQRIHRAWILWILPVPRQVKHFIWNFSLAEMSGRVSNISPVGCRSLNPDWLRSHNAGMGGGCDWLRPHRVLKPMVSTARPKLTEECKVCGPKLAPEPELRGWHQSFIIRLSSTTKDSADTG